MPESIGTNARHRGVCHVSEGEALAIHFIYRRFTSSLVANRRQVQTTTRRPDRQSHPHNHLESKSNRRLRPPTYHPLTFERYLHGLRSLVGERRRNSFRLAALHGLGSVSLHGDLRQYTAHLAFTLRTVLPSIFKPNNASLIVRSVLCESYSLQPHSWAARCCRWHRRRRPSTLSLSGLVLAVSIGGAGATGGGGTITAASVVAVGSIGRPETRNARRSKLLLGSAGCFGQSCF